MKLYLFFFLTSTGCFAQTARDFFFPASGRNLSIYLYKIPTSVDNDGEWVSRVYFRNNGDSAFITTQNAFRTTRDGNVKDASGLREQAVKINEREILAFKGRTNTSTGVETFDKDGEIIFKIPSGKNKKETWVNPYQRGAVVETHCAEFTTVRIDGVKKKAVKVTTTLKRRRSEKTEDFYVDYYVAGIGHYKRTAPGKKKAIEILAVQKYDPHPPTIARN